MRNQTKQHTFWLLAAASAPLAHFSGCGWGHALLAAAAVFPLSLVPKCWEGMPRPMALIEMLWLGAVAGTLLKNGAVYWPSDNDLMVPLTLLALAAVTPEKSAPRISAVVAFCVVLLAIPVAISGVAHLEPEWMRWTTASWPAAVTLVLLFPALPAAGREQKRRQGILVGLMAVVLALLVQGTISPQVAQSVSDPFYQTSRTLGYLEPVVAVAATLGWYAAAVFLLQSGTEIAKNSNIGRGIAHVLPAGTAVLVLLIKWQPEIWLCAILSILLWVLVPILKQNEKLKKHEKKA